MSTKGVTPEHDEIVSEMHIAAPPERVFKALTDPGELKQWFSSPDCPVKMWEMDPRLDGAYRYSTAKGYSARGPSKRSIGRRGPGSGPSSARAGGIAGRWIPGSARN